jgi:3-hydroxyisobutyrate dehydrogenase
MLSNDEAVKEVYESENGLLSQDNWKTDYQYEYSFSWNSRYLTKICTARQVHFIDAPFRSVKPAQDGTLVILVGSSDEDYMLAKPILMFWEKFLFLWVNLVRQVQPN